MGSGDGEADDEVSIAVAVQSAEQLSQVDIVAKLTSAKASSPMKAKPRRPR